MKTTMIDKAISRLQHHGLQYADQNGFALNITNILAGVYGKASSFPPELAESVDAVVDMLIDTLYVPIDSGSDTGELLYQLCSLLRQHR